MNMHSTSHGIGRALGGLALAASATSALAYGAYPDHPIHVIVPWPAGGSVDIATRIITNQAAIGLGQPIVVENKPGAAGSIGASAAAKSAPDGYTLLVATTPMIINRTLQPGLPVELGRDFRPVSLLVNLNYVMVVNPAVASSVQDLIVKAKAQPGRISYASSGPGTQLHLIGEAFKKQAQIDIAHVPYKGAPPALADMVGGHIQLMFPGFPVAEPLLKSGQLKALAVVGKHRLPGLPNVPTLAEAGIPNMDSNEWYGIVAPAGTPENIVGRLNNEIVNAIGTPLVQQQLASHGFDPASSTPQAFAELIQAEQRKWPALVRQAGLRVDQ